MQLQKIQYQLDAIERVVNELNNRKVIDVKMETGTGKTYVYTRLMHELKRQYGYNKFIILVPSVAIKEGVKMSIQNEDWLRHFRQVFGNQTIQLGVVNAGDFAVKSGKRKQMPETLRSFCEAAQSDTLSVNVLLLNAGMLASKSMSNEYDSTLFGSISCPLDGLREAKPILIIDEPHRFAQDNKTWKTVMEKLQPQKIIRFGATFPENDCKPVYELNSVRAFNEGYVKGVHILYPALGNSTAKYKITTDTKSKTAAFTQGQRKIEVKVNDDLAVVDTAFAGITLDCRERKLFLSNDLELENGMTILPETFGISYQELMLSEALNAHFAKERENFLRPDKVKTVSLFFIDSISSFRGENNWLRKKFEELLRNKLNAELKNAAGEYKDFLQASLQNIDAAIAGYFSQDNSDAKVQDEVDDILRNKEQMLTFKDKNGRWNLRRFLFSKWTLREGWDNPNVFVICKLRSSGSENSKIQEVGRGLRLPFDEHGRRLSSDVCNDDFYLTYIVDDSEKDFARKLVGEINASNRQLPELKITDVILQVLVKNGFASADAKVKAKLLNEDVIDEHDTVVDIAKLNALLPKEHQIETVKDGKILDGNEKRPKVRLNKKNFERLKTLWDTVTQRYCLHFKDVDERELSEALSEIFSADMFAGSGVEIVEEKLRHNESITAVERSGYHSADSPLGILPYGQFLKQLHRATCLPVNVLHKAVCSVPLSLQREMFNTMTLQKMIRKFNEVFVKLFAQRFSYSALDYRANTSIFNPDGSFVDEISPGNIGVNKADGTIVNQEKYLYNDVYYDSGLEHEILKVKPPQEVIIYGKLPKRSIALPTYTGGTTTPDFVYAVKNKQNVEIHLVVETKSDNPHLSDTTAVTAQQKVFDTFTNKNIRWRLETDVQAFETELKRLC